MGLRYELLVVLCVVVIATDAAHPSKHHGGGRKDKFLEKVLWHYKQALLMCTNPHNFVCKVDVKNKPTNLMCIDMAWRCDGRPDCPLGDDEKDCLDEECDEGQVRCCDTRECATPCDDWVECAWGEDELNCEAKDLECDGDELKCPNGLCARPCDGIPTCDEGIDERDCNIGEGCRAGEHRCDTPPGGNVTCATPCDDEIECSNEQDEDNCNDESCQTEHIPCLTNEPGSIRQVCAEFCNEITECSDARDEQQEYCKECILCETTSPADQCVFNDECPDP